jgi:hypothetical protein
MHDPDTIPSNFTLNPSSQYANKLPFRLYCSGNFCIDKSTKLSIIFVFFPKIKKNKFKNLK